MPVAWDAYSLTVWAGGVLVASALLDFLYARYTQGCADRRPVYAAWYAIWVMGFQGIAAYGYTHSIWLLLPAMAGAFVGTYLGTKKFRN